MDIKISSMLTFAFLSLSTLGIENACAQNHPYFRTFESPSTDSLGEKQNKTPPANFFPGGRSSANFFEDKEVTQGLVSAERKVTYGTDLFHNPQNAPAPVAAPESSETPQSQDNSNPTNDSWTTNDNKETDELKNLNTNIEKASNEMSGDPDIQNVLAQSKRIKEAIFGKSGTPKESKNSNPTVSRNNPAKETKEIERF